MVDMDRLDLDARHCWLTTTGRITAKRHTSELWFVPADGGIFLMSGSGGLRQWCLDLESEEQGVVRIGDQRWHARSAKLEESPTRTAVLELFHDKYDEYDGGDRNRLPTWLEEAAVFRLVFLREVLI